MKFGKLIGVVVVGTAQVRFVIFVAGTSRILCNHQVPIQLIYPQDGWGEQDPMEILRTTQECINVSLRRIERLGAQPKDIVALGITNKGKTTIVWDKKTMKPLYNAIIWWDSRATKTVKELMQSNECGCNINVIRPICGLPMSSCFSAPKLRWLRDNVPKVKEAMDNGTALFGTIDSWLIYNLTGKNAIHVTDVTNASRTMLMNIEKLSWDARLLQFFGLPDSILPEIRSNCEVYGMALNIPNLTDVPITASLCNSQAALIGLQCFKYGQMKASFGTGSTVTYNSGSSIVQSANGVLTTIAYKLGPDEKAVYAIEGSAGSAGMAFDWLRDQMGLINSVNEIEPMARMVPNSMDVYFVPAFTGLSTPYWNQDARGVICGLTEETTSEHIVRATLDAVCFQIRDVIEAMKKDHRGDFSKLQVNGGLTKNTLFPQILADIAGVTVIPSKAQELEALGAALTAYKAIEPSFNIKEPLCTDTDMNTYKPVMKQSDRDELYTKWKKAVEHSIAWDANMKRITGEDL